MRIVIAGAGVVGRGLAGKLAHARHDVVVIDANREVCEQVYAQLGVTAIHGTATSISTLEDAELDRAECAVGAMRDDSDNLCFALLARNMGVKRVIARMRDPRYEDAYKLAGVTRVLNVVDLYLNQFLWEIEEPAMQEVTAFGEGKACIVFVRVAEQSAAAGRQVAEIAQDAEFPHDCVIVGIFRPDTGEFVIPRGNVKLEAGDRVYLAAHTDAIRTAARYLGAR